MRKLITIFILFSILMFSFTSYTYAAIWDQTEADINYGLLIGTWDQFPIWVEDTFYSEGDIVIYEGIAYVAIKENVPKNIDPINHPASWVFWESE